MKKAVICAFAIAAAAACVPVEDEEPQGSVTYSQELNRNGQMCAGIAALECPTGQTCLITDPDLADAAGFCVGRDLADECDTVRCIDPVCEQGYEPFHTGRGCCDYVCRPAR